ncbi:uncharacterized protein LOC101460540 [Ceratitis capitata]|uniref:uncharacterized protein LOC101460540 n=1 Tax=Ceratitis capitata TaxID=7213 RepID=UPI0003298766|nr:uncharacterized protein LOC101460540 [Ceratitis capitata]
MAKSTALIFLCVFVTVQLITAYPQRDVTIAEVEEVPKRVEPNFPLLKRTLLFAALDAMDSYLETFITQTANFVDGLLGDLQALPDKTDYIQTLITELADLLKRLTDSTSSDKTPLIADVQKMYSNFEIILSNNNNNISTELLRSVLEKQPSGELTLAVEKAMLNSAQKFSALFESYWNILSETQKKDHHEFSEWFEEFQAAKTDTEKLDGLNKFLEIALDHSKENES